MVSENRCANSTEMFQSPSLKSSIFFLWSRSLPKCPSALPALLIDEYYLEDKLRRDQNHPRAKLRHSASCFRKRLFLSLASCPVRPQCREIFIESLAQGLTLKWWVFMFQSASVLACFISISSDSLSGVQAPVAEMPYITNSVDLHRLPLKW